MGHQWKKDTFWYSFFVYTYIVEIRTLREHGALRKVAGGKFLANVLRSRVL